MLAIIPTPPRAPRVRVEVSPNTVLSAFLTSKNANTVRAYRVDLKDFQAFLDMESLEEAVAFFLLNEGGQANAIALEYRTHLVSRKLAAATINRRGAALKSLWKLALLVGLVTTPLTVEPLPEERYRDTRGPGKEGIQKLFAYPSATQCSIHSAAAFGWR